MSAAFDLLQSLRAVGVTVSVDGPDLVLRPGDRVPVDLIPEIQTRKSDLVAYLHPSPDFGAQAEADARILAALIDANLSVGLDDLRDQARTQGIEGARFASGLAALPERLDRLGWGT